MSARRGAARAAALAVVLAACSGTSHGAPGTVSTAGTAGTLVATPPATTTVDKTVQVEAFLVHVLTADPHGARSTLKIAATVTNTLSTPEQFGPEVTVTSDGNTYEASMAKSPTVGPAATVPVEIDASIDSAFTPADALLIFGSSDNNQATVPLGTAAGLEPQLDVAFAPPAPLSAGLQQFTFSRAVVSAYEYDGSDLKNGTRELILTFSVTNADPHDSYGISGSDFTFVAGADTLNSDVVTASTAAAGGTVPTATVYADVDNYKPTMRVTMTVTGADAQLNAVRATTTMILPPLA